MAQLPSELAERIEIVVRRLCVALFALNMLVFILTTLLVVSRLTVLHLVIIAVAGVVTDHLFDRLAREIVRSLLGDHL